MAIDHRTHPTLKESILELIHFCNAVAEACGKPSNSPSWLDVVWTMANRINDAATAEEKQC